MLGVERDAVNNQAYLNEKVCYFKKYLTELENEIIIK